LPLSVVAWASRSGAALAVNLVASYNANRMSTLFDELEKQARLLTQQEKATLARILIEELDPSTDTEVEQIWIAEAQRRYQAYLKGEIESLPGDDVMSRARSRLK
jgi:putative addiction module component (TIGR02574 family)